MAIETDKKKNIHHYKYFFFYYSSIMFAFRDITLDCYTSKKKRSQNDAIFQSHNIYGACRRSSFLLTFNISFLAFFISF